MTGYSYGFQIIGSEDLKLKLELTTAPNPQPQGFSYMDKYVKSRIKYTIYNISTGLRLRHSLPSTGLLRVFSLLQMLN